MILTLPDGEKNELITRAVRHLNPTVPILTRSHTRSDQEDLLHAGASRVIQPELEASATMIDYALEYLKLPPEQASTVLGRFAMPLAPRILSLPPTALSSPLSLSSPPTTFRSSTSLSASRASENAMG